MAAPFTRSRFSFTMLTQWGLIPNVARKGSRMNIQPTLCLRPNPNKVAQFVAPPYDTVSAEEARAFVAAHPQSFMQIDRPETGFEPDHDPAAPEVYEHAHELLHDRQRDFTLLRDEQPCYYLYELIDTDGHHQTGLVCACSVSDYKDGTIRRHEETRIEKENDRLKHIQATQAQTSPVLIAYPDNYAVDMIVHFATAAEPLYDFVFEDGVRHLVWRVARDAAQEALTATFATIPAAYICDGHHRAAAAVRASEIWHAAHPNEEGIQPCDSFLAVLFPANQLRSIAYNRVVTSIEPNSSAELLDGITRAGFELGTAQSEPYVPQEQHSFGMYLEGAWHSLHWKGALDGASAVEHLDVSILQDHLLAPLLSVEDPRRDPRLRFVPASVPATSLQEQAGLSGTAFLLFPTSMREIMAVADAHELMPPKSTWFEPKLLSGLFLRPLRSSRH